MTSWGLVLTELGVEDERTKNRILLITQRIDELNQVMAEHPMRTRLKANGKEPSGARRGSEDLGSFFFCGF